tara:strand:- start:3315 stop:4526 length:1212 start_codon:yes stop_codon:yes gene_type:complete
MSEEAVQQDGDFKVKKSSMKKFNKEPETIKVDLSAKKAPAEADVTKVSINSGNANKEQEATNVVADKPAEIVSEVEAEVSSGESSIQNEGFSGIQEITEEEEEKEIKEEVKEVTKEIKEAIRDERVSGKPLPENIEKLVSFMEETGGNVEDYVRLNADYSTVDNNALLKEYYRKSKPHLDDDEINFLLEDNFSYNEELDEERDIRKRKLAFKEEVAEAKTFLEDLKGKYYDEIKLRPGVTQEQKKAMDFFNRYNEEQDLSKQRKDRFKKATSNLLNDDFKGFEYNIGEKKFRYGVNNPTKIAQQQSDMTNFIGKFLNDKGEVADHKGYHKAMHAAENMDQIASHFYEQGKADAVKDVVNSSKNISDTPRQTASDSVFINGLKVKAVNGIDSSKLKIKKSQFNN